MKEIAWNIINGLCRAVGFGFFICLIFGDWRTKDILKLGSLAAGIVIIILIIGKILFN